MLLASALPQQELVPLIVGPILRAHHPPRETGRSRAQWQREYIPPGRIASVAREILGSVTENIVRRPTDVAEMTWERTDCKPSILTNVWSAVPFVYHMESCSRSKPWLSRNHRNSMVRCCCRYVSCSPSKMTESAPVHCAHPSGGESSRL
ncbi:hypothetical protein BS47DRAFT_452029 [Hydnum rufescens UP504]|uniref:Uncharacterized protein n=1 Tax=Hydnum rufescens UP504 TaxID=1448309 RepID=A0A9P6DKL4_9AGAM|nr:hypothetical protein BS47DRAFT_452029 [Hydnum rufescens UP504]